MKRLPVGSRGAHLGASPARLAKKFEATKRQVRKLMQRLAYDWAEVDNGVSIAADELQGKALAELEQQVQDSLARLYEPYE